MINSLTYSFKNNFIFWIIERFSFFKGISNTNFLSAILYNFSSVIFIEILINKNEIIEGKIFVKEGQLFLELTIDMEKPEI